MFFQPAHEVAHPVIKLVNAFTARVLQLGAPLHPQPGHIRVKPADLVKGQPFKLTEVDLPQLRTDYYLQLVPGGDGVGG